MWFEVLRRWGASRTNVQYSMTRSGEGAKFCRKPSDDIGETETSGRPATQMHH